MSMGSAFPDEFASAMCIQSAALSQNEETLVLASLGNSPASPQVSSQMRRLFGPRGFASRRDVLVARDMDTASGEEDFEAWMALREANRAKKEGGSQGKRGKSLGGSVLEIPLIGARERGIGVLRVIANTTTHPSVRKEKVGTAALRPP